MLARHLQPPQALPHAAAKDFDLECHAAAQDLDIDGHGYQGSGHAWQATLQSGLCTHIVDLETEGRAERLWFMGGFLDPQNNG